MPPERPDSMVSNSNPYVQDYSSITTNSHARARSFRPKYPTIYPPPPNTHKMLPILLSLPPLQTPSYLPPSSAHQHSTSLLVPMTSPPLNNAATSTLSGLSVSGQLSSMRTARTHSKRLYAGVHASLSKSRHISPVDSPIFGCMIGVRKRIWGGRRGYVVGMVMEMSHLPAMGVF